jgi:hypothetical protein
MRTLLRIMRGILGISVAAVVTVTVWSNFPTGGAQAQLGSKVSIEPIDKLFTRSIPTPTQD